MGKRGLDFVDDEPPPRKKSSSSNKGGDISIGPGEILIDMTGKEWKLGHRIGTGGFGEIFLISDKLNRAVDDDAKYICKIEEHKSGPLFVERNCYLRIGKLETNLSKYIENLFNKGMFAQIFVQGLCKKRTLLHSVKYQLDSWPFKYNIYVEGYIVQVKQWKADHKMKLLGIPHYVASGSHMFQNMKYRFLIIPKYDSDLEQIFNKKGQKFNLKTVCKLSMQIIDVLEYIHSHGYVHADIKASNLLLRKNSFLNKKPVPVKSDEELISCINVRCHGAVPKRTCRLKQLPQIRRSLRPNGSLKSLSVYDKLSELGVESNDADPKEGANRESDQVYLVDYGLATKYLHTDNRHKEYCTDERKAHAGTLLFCSVDAHKGAQSRRSDLECLGYNIIHWMTGGNLPWKDDVDDPLIIEKKKMKCLKNLEEFLLYSFNYYPKFIYDYFSHLQKLRFDEKPDYNYYKNLFKKAIIENGYKNDNYLDFDNTESKMNKIMKKPFNIENKHKLQAARKVVRSPLRSNIYVKPLLRKYRCKKTISWSKILMDPEDIIKQHNQKERKSPDIHDMACNYSLQNLDLESLNPTQAMIDVYNRRNKGWANNKGDSNLQIDGYTPAMMAIVAAKKRNRKMACENMVVCSTTSLGNNRRRKGAPIPRAVKIHSSKVTKTKKIYKISPKITRSVSRHKRRSDIIRSFSDICCGRAILSS